MCDNRVIRLATMLKALACLIIALSGCAAASSPPHTSIYPKGKQLLFSAYTIREPELSIAKSVGFSAIGPYHGNNKHLHLKQASDAFLPLIYSVGPKLNFDNGPIDQDALLKAIATEIRQVATLDNIALWNIRNEELRYWKPAEMKWLEGLTTTIRENDPQRRPIMMYEPNHRRADELLITGQYLDIVSKGSYTNFVGLKQSRTWLRWSMEQSMAVANATGNVPIAVLWMARDQEADDDIAAIPRWVRHDVYLSLVSGAKGILIYSAFNRRPGFSKHFSEFFNAYAAAANELNGPAQLGQVFLFGEQREDLVVRQTSGPQSQEFVYRDRQHSYPVVHSSQRELNGRHYLFIVNSANNPISVSIDGLDTNQSVIDAFSEQPVTIADGLSLAPLEVRAFHWE
jgi:hypothetical protein